MSVEEAAELAWQAIYHATFLNGGSDVMVAVAQVKLKRVETRTVLLVVVSQKAMEWILYFRFRWLRTWKRTSAMANCFELDEVHMKAKVLSCFKLPGGV
ncbi:uncharacterized protein [Triticum aestivum]|uniref:uncharacterized protein isoform X2 n=1 Tax=Triticum aestivum TaxID=4565 RepID=UPI001D025023|nr:uncharacterized protein LOC123172854 isoform X2 [Triticum aestivum]